VSFSDLLPLSLSLSLSLSLCISISPSLSLSLPLSLGSGWELLAYEEASVSLAFSLLRRVVFAALR